MKEHPKKYWTKERCLEEGSKHKYKKDFVLKSKGAFTAARRNGWLPEIWSKMQTLGNRYKRCVYVYEFSDRSAYIGLTYNIEQRDYRHKRSGPVFNHIQKTGLIPILKNISDYIDINQASALEISKVEEYRNKDWNILNIKKAGELGGNTLFWTKEECFNAALKCKTKNEFLRKFRGAHHAATQGGWLHEIQEHMDEIMKPKNFWTKERCKNEALKYKSKREFRDNGPSAYLISHRNGWFKEIASHLK